MNFFLTFILLFSISSSSNDCFNLFKNNSFQKFPYEFGRLSYSSNLSKRSFESIDDIKFGTYNLENFAAKSLSLSPDEIHKKVKNIFESIKKSNVDVITLQEVLDVDYFKFNVKKYLGDEYQVLNISKEGNTDNIVFLVKNDLPLEFELHSMKHYKMNGRDAFNKDFPILEVKHGGRPIVFYGGLHLKSKFGGSGLNNFFEDVRFNQIKSILNIKQKIESTFRDVPFVIAGDFNNDLRRSAKEVDLLKKYMTDAFDSVAIADNMRTTQISSYKGKKITGQLDGVYFSHNDKISVKNVETYTYVNSSGERILLDDSRLNRDMLDSDHLMLVTTFDFKKMMGL